MKDSIKTTLNQMKINPKIWSEGGVFTMIHAAMPHHPYREEDCSITDRHTPPSKEGDGCSRFQEEAQRRPQLHPTEVHRPAVDQQHLQQYCEEAAIFPQDSRTRSVLLRRCFPR